MKDYRKNIKELDKFCKEEKYYPRLLFAETLGAIGLLLSPIDFMFHALPMAAFPTVLFFIGAGYRNISKYTKGNRVIKENKEFYLELMKEYDEYIDIIGNLLVEYEDKYENEDELVFAYTLYYLLSWGYFSQNNNYKYHIHKILDCIDNELEGMYVIEGNCCCRHNTAFISDLLYYMGFNTIDITTSVSKLDKKLPEHSICGFVNKESFAFDFTSGIPYSIDYSNKKLYFPGNRNTGQKPHTQYYIDYDPRLCTNITDDMVANSKELSIELVEYCEEKGYNLAIEIAKTMREIEEDLNPIKQDISAKSLKLMPRKF